MYKVAFIDLDGTLLTKGKKIADHDMHQLINFARMGGKIILNSGRWHPSVINFANQINNLYDDAVPYIGSYNGAALFDVKEKKFLIYNLIDSSMFRKIVEISNKFKIIALIYSSDGKSLFLNRFPFKFLFDRYLNGKTFKAGKYINNEISISKIILISGFKKRIKQTWEFINKNFGKKYNICFTQKRAIEINSFNSNKGVVVEKVLELLNLKKQDSISFGDSFNDLDMFKKTAFSVCLRVKKNKLLNFCSVNSFDNKGFLKEFNKNIFYKREFNKNFFIDCSFINEKNLDEFKKLVKYAKIILNKKIILISNRDLDEVSKLNDKIGKEADFIIHNGTHLNNKTFPAFFKLPIVQMNEVIFFYTNSKKVYYLTKIKNFNIQKFVKENFLITDKSFKQINLFNLNLKIVSAEKFYFKNKNNVLEIDYFEPIVNYKIQKSSLKKIFLKNEITPDSSTGFFTQLINLNFPKEIFKLNINFNEQFAHLLKK